MFKKLLEVQKEIGAIIKDSKNPFYKSSYFDINALLDVVKPSLNKRDLLLLQPLSTITEYPVIITMLIDTETGEKLEFPFLLPAGLTPQNMGSAITYYRRYCLQSLLGLQAQDDDANGTLEPKIIPGSIQETKFKYGRNK